MACVLLKKLHKFTLRLHDVVLTFPVHNPEHRCGARQVTFNSTQEVSPTGSGRDADTGLARVAESDCNHPVADVVEKTTDYTRTFQ